MRDVDKFVIDLNGEFGKHTPFSPSAWDDILRLASVIEALGGDVLVVEEKTYRGLSTSSNSTIRYSKSTPSSIARKDIAVVDN